MVNKIVKPRILPVTNSTGLIKFRLYFYQRVDGRQVSWSKVFAVEAEAHAFAQLMFKEFQDDPRQFINMYKNEKTNIKNIRNQYFREIGSMLRAIIDHLGIKLP